jgi:hypothetical protein
LAKKQDQNHETAEAMIMVNSLIKETIVPNLSTSLDSLMDEDAIPTLPALNVAKDPKDLGSKSMPGSKRSTPREGKNRGAMKSAPQTPQKKKH